MKPIPKITPRKFSNLLSKLSEYPSLDELKAIVLVDNSKIEQEDRAGDTYLLHSERFDPEKIEITKIKTPKTASFIEWTEFFHSLDQIAQIYSALPQQIIVLTKPGQKENPEAVFSKEKIPANFLDTAELDRLNSDIEGRFKISRPINPPLNHTQRLLNLGRAQLVAMHN